ncbi:VVA0879 family protein [Streptomyces sp. NPDC059161]|uniref:VVA0879 family protein n=1 Tax=Streptomyces sp. NPDC059161 TaxID=3346749 RepID=UPI00367E521A
MGGLEGRSMARNRTAQRKARQLQQRAGDGLNAARDQVIALPPLRARLTHEEWLAAGRARFGTDDIRQWSALCPRCGHVTSVARFAEVSGTTELTQAFTECLGRHLPGTGSHTFPCDWAAWGHIPLYGYTVVVDERELRVFAFPAPDEDVAKNKARQEERAVAWQARLDAQAEAEEDQEGDEDQSDVVTHLPRSACLVALVPDEDPNLEPTFRVFSPDADGRPDRTLPRRVRSERPEAVA